MAASDSDLDVVSDSDLDPNYSASGSSENEVVDEVKVRKRKRNKHLWKSLQRKYNLNKGLPYTSTTGESVPARQGYECDCKSVCTSKISAEEKESILSKFNDLGEKNVQDSYLFGLITVKSIERRRPDLMKKRLISKGTPVGNNLTDADLIQTSKRNSSFAYKIIVEKRERMVCKKAFAGLHGIKFGRVDRIGLAKKNSSTPPLDKRGLSEGSRVLKKSDDQIRQIETHINSFPIRISHYTRNKSKRKFLSPELSVMKMHQLYVEQYEPEAYAQWKVDKRTKFKINYEFYLHIFNTRFNLSFGKPKTDVCNTCDKLKNQIDATENAEEKSKLCQEHSLHLAKANKFYNDLKHFSERAKTDETMDVISFDYQQNLPVPVLPVGDIFYKRQLWVFNQCFYSAKTGNSHMYMYNEVEGKKGANETVSFLKHYIYTFVHPSVKTLYIFTDNCVGQNKNIVVVQILSALVATGKFNVIYHRFPERGHSFLPCDRKFALIEKEKRKVTYLYLPEEWYSKVARTSKSFSVVSVLPKMLGDYRSYLQPFFKKTIKNFTVSKYKSFKYEGRNITVSVCHNIESLRQNFIAFKDKTDIGALNEWNVAQLYNKKLPLNPKKLQNLRELLEFIPLAYHRFYTSLETDNREEEDVTGTEASDSSDES